MIMSSFLNAFLDVILPPLCHVCRSYISDAGALHICQSCRSQIQLVTTPLCTTCGVPFNGAGSDHICGACLTDRPCFDSARAAVIHEGHCRHLIHAFKYNNKTHLRRALALLITEHLTEFVALLKPDMIVPVPLHIQRLRKRGFNQAILLGEILARAWRVPMERRALKRVRKTEPQITLSAKERRDNVRNAFEVGHVGAVSGKRIVLVDDVLTTGCTADECARVLKKAGALEVTVITAARAINI